MNCNRKSVNFTAKFKCKSLFDYLKKKNAVNRNVSFCVVLDVSLGDIIDNITQSEKMLCNFSFLQKIYQY